MIPKRDKMTDISRDVAGGKELKENIMNYTNTAIFKPVVGRYDYSGQVETHAGLWRNTAAITSVSMVSLGQAFVTGSTFTLYGIKAA